MTENCQCDGPCVCADIESFLSQLNETVVGRAVRMQNDMFDIGIGRALVDGEAIVNVMVHSPGEYDDNDPSMLTMSFGQQETMKLISLLIRGYEENWPDDEP